jgi:coenzyme Q-binding protein COQ10
MATNSLLRFHPAVRCIRAIPQRRYFITLPGTELQTLTATRVLPYKTDSLYSLIADVDNYSTFLPYCLNSKVTKWSAPDTDGKRWPSEGDLTIGWGGFEETFSSRLYCVPGSIVEALGGDAVSTIPKADLPHYSGTLHAPNPAHDNFKSLNTRWTFVPFHSKSPTGKLQTNEAVLPTEDHQTEVKLTIDFELANPIYAALTKTVSSKVASVMIEAFEARAKLLLHGTD